MSKEPFFTDKEVRDALNLHKLPVRKEKGGDTDYYRFGLLLRNLIEDKIDQEGMAIKSETFESLIREVNTWQDETFPYAIPKSAAAHLLREAEELYENPLDQEEMADIFILVAGVAHLSGVDLKTAVRNKLEVNKRRIWGKPDKEGVVEHVKAGVPVYGVDKPTEWIEVDTRDRKENIRWEPVKQLGTNRTGKVMRYSRNGKEYAGRIIWDDEIEGEEKGDAQTTDM